MKALIVYDSKWGNTEKVALAIAKGMGKNGQTIHVSKVAEAAIHDFDLLVIGSPVIGGKPSKVIQEFLNQLSVMGGRKRRFAVFDTRMATKFAKRFGYAAVKMYDQLSQQGETVVSEPMGFVVKGQKGPLEEGELDRSEQWGSLVSKLK
jgi:flavodoxin I